MKCIVSLVVLILHNDTSGGTKGVTPACPPPDQIFLNFMQFLGKFVCWRLSMEGWRPLLRRILDPPLDTSTLFNHMQTRQVPDKIFEKACFEINLDVLKYLNMTHNFSLCKFTVQVDIPYTVNSKYPRLIREHYIVRQVFNVWPSSFVKIKKSNIFVHQNQIIFEQR